MVKLTILLASISVLFLSIAYYEESRFTPLLLGIGALVVIVTLSALALVSENKHDDLD